MHKNKIILRIMLGLMITSMLILAGCSPKETATTDPNMVYTEVAQTVAAEMGNTEATNSAQIDVNEVKTQAVQTVIAELTLNAPEPTATETVAPVRPTATPQATSDTQESSTGDTTQTDSTTKPTAKAKVEDAAQFLYQYPGDDYEFNPGSKFDAVFRFKNTGPTTWNDSYTLRWYLNNKFGLEQLKFTLAEAGSEHDVKPGETVEITIQGMEAPMAAGTYQSNWRLCNDKVQCFYLVYIQIVVK